MTESIEVSTILAASPERVYKAWMDSKEHGLFTAEIVEIDPNPGGCFTAGSGYIEGTTLELEPYRRILQAWRTTEFPEDSPDSVLELLFEAAPGGTLLTLKQSKIPDGQGESYRQGWIEFYFTPMEKYFS